MDILRLAVWGATIRDVSFWWTALIIEKREAERRFGGIVAVAGGELRHWSRDSLGHLPRVPARVPTGRSPFQHDVPPHFARLASSKNNEAAVSLGRSTASRLWRRAVILQQSLNRVDPWDIRHPRGGELDGGHIEGFVCGDFVAKNLLNIGFQSVVGL